MQDLTARNHRLRAALSEEMHIRRPPRFAAPCRLMQVIALIGEGEAESARAHIEGICAGAGQDIAPHARYIVCTVGRVTLVWERHSEFASYMLIREGPFDEWFDPGVFGPLADDMLTEMPGAVIRATQIAVEARGADEPDPAIIAKWFAPEALVKCDVMDGKARIMSDFRLNDDGFGRLYVDDRGLSGDEPPRLVVRLQELGNYRNMALLGLPLAQQLTPEVSRLESRLAELTRAVSEHVSEDEHLLDELTFLSAALARLVAETRYRMSATRAYAQLSVERLQVLKLGAIDGFQTLADFTERRLMPAVRTCESFSQRLDDLSQRAAWTSALLRTRIDIALARQNRDLLESMDGRTRLQLRLQQTVEGLSIVAISYYLVAMASYVFGALPGLDPKIATAAAVPIVLLVVWLLVRRLRRTFHE